ncbi:MAG: hypothetical protein HRU29_11540 [Rhizobiales bacterium]|nr:hypothetical protein [Hyphomicrobiales bacterium]NRB15022.1 hypothetical protein [Hyphomicrobiales bacterium]
MVYSPNYIERSQKNSLLTAVDAQIRLVGNQTDAARIIGVTKQTVAKWASRTAENEAHWMHLAAIADLQLVGGYPHIAEALARFSGYCLYKDPDLLGSFKDWKMTSNFLLTSTEVVRDMAECLADDNQISAKEIRDKNMIEDLSKHITVAITILELLNEKVAADE